MKVIHRCDDKMPIHCLAFLINNKEDAVTKTERKESIK